MTQARSDRKPFGVEVWRGYWHAWYYGPDGKRVKNKKCIGLRKDRRGNYIDSDMIHKPLEFLRQPPPEHYDRETRDAYVKGCPNYLEAMRAAENLWKQAQDRAAGRATSAQDVGQQARHLQPIEMLFDDFMMSLKRRNLAECYQHKERLHLEYVQKQLGWKTLADFDTAKFQQFLDDLRFKKDPDTGKAHGVAIHNHYRGTWVRFFEWCVKQKIRPENLARQTVWASKRNQEEQRPIRAFTVEEFNKLLAVPEVNAPMTPPVPRGLKNKGPDGKKTPRSEYQLSYSRRLVYTVCAGAGFRWNELRQLQKQDCDPTGAKPLWHLERRAHLFYYKPKDAFPLPMRPDLAELLLPHWQALPDDTTPIFELLPTQRVLDKDMIRAGIAKSNGRGNLSFHSFRHYFATQMRKNFPIEVVQQLMRHKDIQTTANIYVEMQTDDLAAVWGK